MKTTVPAPERVPRLNSLLHRLRHTPGPDDDPYLDQLMMFLDDPPPDTGDRWKKGAAMCAAWGITTSATSVYRLFCSYAAEWRASLVLGSEPVSEEVLAGIRRKNAHLVTLRVGQILADPGSTPATLLGIARLELARQKHMEGKGGDAERALTTLANRSWFNWEAQFALTQLREALQKKSSKPSPFPAGYLDACTAFPTLFPPKD
jgi:hypothetical protein